MLPGQVSEWRTYRPDGQQVGYWEAHLGDFIQECYWQDCYLNDYVSLPNAPSSIGTWLVQIEHEGEVYEHTFNVQYPSLGDMNNDGSLNVIDIVMAVDLILNDNYDVVGDVNEDGQLNVIDIVMLVDWVLNGMPEADSDGDGVIDEDDSDPNNPYQCSDLDGDTCDDCSTGTFNPSDDGFDYDGDGQCDDGDCDDDNDGCQECWDYCP